MSVASERESLVRKVWRVFYNASNMLIILLNIFSSNGLNSSMAET